jgi:transcription initiation factor TFIIIB Brf1 subunit/transcription initiation factor TFIIB
MTSHVFDVTFMGVRWGLRGAMMEESSTTGLKVRRFKSPLRVTGVDYASEAHMRDVLVGDVVIAVLVKDVWVSLREGVTCLDHQRLISPALSAIFEAGGVITMRLLRLRGQLCEGCKSSELVENTKEGDITCSNCGLVDRERVPVMSAEWRNFSDGVDDGRVGQFGESEQTFVGGGMKKENRNQSETPLHRANRLLVSTVRVYPENALVEHVGSLLDVSESMVARAKQLVQMVKKEKPKGIVHGMPLVLTAVRIASVEHGETHTIKSLTTVAGGVCIFKRTLNIVQRMVDTQRLEQGLGLARANPTQQVQRIVQVMRGSFKMGKIAEDITTCVHARGIAVSRSGTTVAAGAIYMAYVGVHQIAHDTALLQKIAESSGLHHETVLHSYTAILNSLNSQCADIEHDL